MAGVDAAARVWPVLGLTLTTPDLLLRPAQGEHLLALAAAVPDDLELDPASARYAVPEPANRRAAVLQGVHRALGTWTAQSWVLPFVVLRDGVVIGEQTLEGERFAALRTVDTASWLVPGERGRGFGRQMRAAVLTLAFEHLGAVAAVTSAWHDNHASLAVSRSLGYRDNGVSLHLRESGERDELVHLRLRRVDWGGRERPHVGVEGMVGCAPWFGLEA